MRTLALACVLAITNQAAQIEVGARAKQIIGSLSSGNFAAVEAQCTEQMSAALPAGRIGATWTAFVAQAGPFKGCGAGVRVRSIADKQMVISPCEFERAKADIQIAFDRDGRISGMVVRPAAEPSAPYALPAYANPAAYTDSARTDGG